MTEQIIAFQVGDQVVHREHGLGEIIQLDEKKLFGHTAQYYVVKIRDITLWVHVGQKETGCLRYLTPAKDFRSQLEILTSPGEPLPPDRLERKNQLTERMKAGTLDAICRVIRDLVAFKKANKINEYDSAILKRAREFLLDEWSNVFSVSIQQADDELDTMLKTR